MRKNWILVLGGWIGVCSCHSEGPRTDAPVATATDVDRDSLEAPQRAQVVFGDSLNRAFFWDEVSRLNEGDDHTLRVDGMTVVYIARGEVPFAIKTTLMDVEVLELPLLLRADAFDRDAGQSLEVYSGALKVQKHYSSPFPSLDTLRAGDLYMINKDIDLSEKEKLDDMSVLDWWKSYAESVR